MKLKDLKENCDFYINRGHADDEVMITLSMPSVGCRAFSKVSSAFSGFDWENDQFRIEPEEELVLKEKDRDIPVRANRKIYHVQGGRTINVIKCPVCENKLTRSINYCGKCGQRIEKGKYKDIPVN